MIQELIESLLTPIAREARSLGYLHESIAMRRRYLRHKEEWRNHLEECWRHILAASEGAKTVDILGSGPLLDIPMDELIERCDRITLVDIVHPREVRRRWDQHPKVQLIETDILGVAAALLAWRGGALPRPAAYQPQADFVVSANCLSQLHLKPLEFLAGKVSPDALESFAHDLADAHLRTLEGRNHLLITDFETRLLGPEGQVLEKAKPPIQEHRLNLLQSWHWLLAPPGEIHRRNSIEMSVGAFSVK